MPQTMRFSIEDKADYMYYKSKMDKKMMTSIEDSANEAARRINSNADLNTARELIGIENAAHEIAESQIQAAFIIESAIQAGTDKIVDSIEDLRALFDIRSARIIWLLEQNHKELMNLLGKIYEKMITPSETEAKEKTKWAINAYNKGWFDQAIEYFNISKAKYPFDFIVYQFLGNIYLFEKREFNKALENYKLALKYIADSSSYYTSLAYLHIGLSHYEMGNYQDAYDASYNAVQINPELSEANYLCAQNCSKLGNDYEAMNYLKNSIDADRGYCLKALKDEAFEPSSLKHLMEKLTRDEKTKASTEIEKSNQLVNTFNDIDMPHEVRDILMEAINLSNAGTYLNYRDAKYKAKASQKVLLDSLSSKLSNELPNLEIQLNDLDRKRERICPRVKNYKRYALISFPFAILGYPLIYAIILEIFFDDYLSGSMLLDTLNRLPIPERLEEPFFALLWISMFGVPIFLYNLINYIWLLPSAIALKNIKSLNETIAKKRQIWGQIESEKKKLKIEKFAETFNYIDYENYLRKTLG